MKTLGILVISVRGVNLVNTSQKLFHHQEMKLAIHAFILNFLSSDEE